MYVCMCASERKRERERETERETERERETIQCPSLNEGLPKDREGLIFEGPSEATFDETVRMLKRSIKRENVTERKKE